MSKKQREYKIPNIRIYNNLIRTVRLYFNDVELTSRDHQKKFVALYQFIVMLD